MLLNLKLNLLMLVKSLLSEKNNESISLILLLFVVHIAIIQLIVLLHAIELHTLPELFKIKFDDHKLVISTIDIIADIPP